MQTIGFCRLDAPYNMDQIVIEVKAQYYKNGRRFVFSTPGGFVVSPHYSLREGFPVGPLGGDEFSGSNLVGLGEDLPRRVV